MSEATKLASEDLSESPIEGEFLAHLLGSQVQRARVALDGRGIVRGAYEAFFVGGFGTSLGLAALVVPQLRLRFGRDRMRVDVGVLAEAGGHRVSIALECDGWEFHSSAEDVQSDKRRDRLLQAHGWLVFRYPGREIMDRPEMAVAAFWRDAVLAIGSWSQVGELVTLEALP